MSVLRTGSGRGWRRARLRMIAAMAVIGGMIALVVAPPAHDTDAAFTDAEKASASFAALTLPAITAPITCTQVGLLGVGGARVAWTAPASMPTGAGYLVTITVVSSGAVASMFVPSTTTSLTLNTSLGGVLGELLNLNLGQRFTVSVTTATSPIGGVGWTSEPRRTTQVASTLALLWSCP